MTYIIGILMLGAGVLVLSGSVLFWWGRLGIRFERLSGELADEDDLEEYEGKKTLGARLVFAAVGLTLAAAALNYLEQLF